MKPFIRAFLVAFFFTLGLVGADAANRFAVCNTTCTWDNSDTSMWSASTGGATGASTPVAADDVIFDGATCVGGTTCTITTNATLSINTLTFSACTGSTTGCILDFSVNNNNITIAVSATAAGTGTRTLRMGGGTWTVNNSSGGTPWNFATVTNMTLTAGTSTVLLTGTTAANRNIVPGSGFSYNAWTFNANTGGGTITLSALVTSMGAFTVNGPNVVLFPAANTITTTSTTINGTAANPVSLASATGGFTATISAASSPVLTWVALREMVCAGAAGWAFTSSFNLGRNSTCTIGVPGSGGGGGIFGG